MVLRTQAESGKAAKPSSFDSQELYLDTLRRALRELDAFASSCSAEVLVVMDQHPDRDLIMDQAARLMYTGAESLTHIVEPPFEVESHRYQTCQCAGWLCGLIGRFGAYRAAQSDFSDFEWAERYYAPRVDALAVRSAVTLAPVIMSGATHAGE